MYSTIRIPKKYKRSIDLLLSEIVTNEKARNKIIEILKDDVCPFCNVKLKNLQKFRYYWLKECPKCGYTKPVLDSNDISKEDILSVFSIGVITGLSVHSVAKKITKREII